MSKPKYWVVENEAGEVCSLLECGSFASQLVSSGASLPLIGALLGHATRGDHSTPRSRECRRTPTGRSRPSRRVVAVAGKKRRFKLTDNDLVPPTLVGLTRLLDDLRVIQDEHPELYFRIYELIGWLLTPQGFIWSGPNKKDNKDWMRHAVSRRRLELSDKWDGDEAFEKAGKELAHHPAGMKAEKPIKARTLRESYRDIEKELPAELRRPRTYRPK